MTTALQTVTETLKALMPRFEERLDGSTLESTCKREFSFAVQAFERNDYLCKIAGSNQISLRNAILNVADIGISLNPAKKFAYLVPRDGKVCLDISYQGLLYMAVREGRIKRASADIVREGDEFKYKGRDEKPEHTYNPFAKGRQESPVVGVYCIAHLPDGDVIVDVMSADEIEKIRNSSAAAKKDRQSPWDSWYEEMAKKTIIKRAYKYWPQAVDQSRATLSEAIDMLNDQGEGLDVSESNADKVADVLDSSSSQLPSQEKQAASVDDDFVSQMNAYQDVAQGE